MMSVRAVLGPHVRLKRFWDSTGVRISGSSRRTYRCAFFILSCLLLCIQCGAATDASFLRRTEYAPPFRDNQGHAPATNLLRRSRDPARSFSFLGLSATVSTAQFEPDCSCDCCMTVREETARGLSETERRAAAFGNICAPRVQVDSNSDCPSSCSATQSVAEQLEAEGTQVDYSRFCTNHCRAASEEVQLLCIPVDDVVQEVVATEEMVVEGRPAVPLEGGSVSSAIPTNVAVASTAGIVPLIAPGPLPDVQLRLAQSEAAAARSHAIAAGQAAKKAREAYEAILQVSTATARDASEAALKQLKREASLQADQAVLARVSFVNKAQADAAKAAYEAADVYDKARQRDMVYAKEWEDRAMQLGAAATERDRVARTASTEATFHRQLRSLASDKQALYLAAAAKRSEDDASTLRKKAEVAWFQAAEIRNRSFWYIAAEKAAAASAVAKNLPSGVPPPPLPLLANLEAAARASSTATAQALAGGLPPLGSQGVFGAPSIMAMPALPAMDLGPVANVPAGFVAAGVPGMTSTGSGATPGFAAGGEPAMTGIGPGAPPGLATLPIFR
eukprot:TRINITY_DN24732_c0_g2_i1.p1 TRINITY_DN24732_c0_g2~~TRINITY_DN24732_c0_g2_i1.p1  ORF type:complete len:587 (+),score=92.77 TRINITY_DN24732_c0_g2_i1:74-1762(+)